LDQQIHPLFDEKETALDLTQGGRPPKEGKKRRPFSD
jgi:hypothetical protein